MANTLVANTFSSMGVTIGAVLSGHIGVVFALTAAAAAAWSGIPTWVRLWGHQGHAAGNIGTVRPQHHIGPVQRYFGDLKCLHTRSTSRDTEVVHYLLSVEWTLIAIQLVPKAGYEG